MKIIMLVNNNCKYDSRVLREAGSLSKSGYELTVYSFLDNTTTPVETRDAFIIKRITSKNTRNIRLFINLAALLSYIRYYYQFLIRLNKEKVDIYHCHDLLMLPLGFLARLLKHSKLVYDSHELYVEQANIGKCMKAILKFAERIMIKSADKVITVNEFIARELSARYKIVEPVVVKNCPPLTTDETASQNNDIRNVLHLNDNRRIILYVGGLVHGRGLNNLVLASQYLENASFVFLGDGLLKPELVKLTREMSLNDKVIFLEPVLPDKLISFVRTADVGMVVFQAVDLNNYYGSPNKFFEYIIAGLPVVCSNFPFMQSHIENYNIGKTCNPENPKDIASAINWVITDKTRYHELKDNVKKARQILNWENESKKLLGLYQELE